MVWSSGPHLLDEIEPETVHEDEGDRSKKKKWGTEWSKTGRKQK